MMKPSVSESNSSFYSIQNSETLHTVQRSPFNEFILHVFQKV